MQHLKKIFEQLNLTPQNGLVINNNENNSYLNIFSSRVERLLLNTIKPDAVFCMDKKPFILFFENLTIDEKKEKSKQIWNFNDAPVVIMVNKDSVEVYNGFKYLTADSTLSRLDNLENNGIDDFNYFKMVTGDTWKKYAKDFDKKNRLYDKLLENIKYARDQIILELNHQDKIEIANSLLGKIIFVRYLIDRQIKLNFNGSNSKELSNNELCEILADKSQIKLFFNYLKTKFNGDLFPINDNIIDKIPEKCFNILISLLRCDELKTGQQSLFDIYDFSIIPVEFISNIYESFIGQNQQAITGAFYTPLFLVDYILAETVEQKFNNDNKIYDCKVLDPSCGSGIFLVEVLRKIIEQYNKNNPNHKKNTEQYKQKLKELVHDNIFGVDKDKRAIDVAIFSIYLTLLDYQEASDIENFKFPNLLNSNFFVADFFDITAKFNEIFNKFEFDFILGNPPWGAKDSNLLVNSYISNRKNMEKNKKDVYQIAISNKEIAQAFVLRTRDFCKPKTKCALIVTSKILYNLKANNFRQYLLHNYLINKVFELSPVRTEIFNNANAPATILFYRPSFSADTNNNIIEHISLKPNKLFSMFKIFTIHRHDYKKVIQKRLKDFDYLWKVLIYGSYLDFNLIQHIKSDYKTNKNIMDDNDNLSSGTGIIVGGGDKNDASHLIGKPFIKANDISHFLINPKLTQWSEETVHRQRDKNLFDAPMLLSAKRMKNFRILAVICKMDAVFLDAITVIKCRESDIEIIEIMSGIMYSSFSSYLAMQTFSDVGVGMYMQTFKKEREMLPFMYNKDISTIVQNLHNKHDFDLLGKNPKLLSTELIKQLDDKVIEAFSLSEKEKSLIDYTMNVTIPNINKCYDVISKPQELYSNVIQDYINIFFNRFNPIHKKQNLQLNATIKFNEDLIFIEFGTIDIKDSNPIIWEGLENKYLFKLKQLAIEKVTDKLFIQKDIRGFEKNSFYIIKPNEMKLWHKAIAYLDVNEFMDAILTAGRKVSSNVR